MRTERIGIVSIGEMGHACARLFRKNGAEVLTVLNGRSERTQGLARDAGVAALQDLRALVEATDLILSLVTPSSAMAVCRGVAEALGGSRSPVFVDANPTSPMLAVRMAGVIRDAGGRFLDGAIIGAAAHVGGSTALYVSGPGANEMSRLERYGLRVKVLGDEIGQASALKIFNAGLNKGIAALLIEFLVGASRAGILDKVVELYDEGFLDLVRRMDGSLASMALHASRRSEEMVELGQALSHWGMEPVMAKAVGDLLSRVAALRLDPIKPEPGAYRRLLEALVEKGFLGEAGRLGMPGAPRGDGPP